MTNLDKFNPASAEDFKTRKDFEGLPPEEKTEEIDRLHERALIENSDSFYKLAEKETGSEEKENLELAIKICEAIKREGGAALVVGGFARDAALSKFGDKLRPKDIDLEVYGIEPEKLKEILEEFGKIDLVGAQFGVIKIKGLDISIPRRDSKIGKGHKGFAIEGDPRMLVREAAQRRDFTINALALDPLTGEILDFYGGIDDIKSKTLRATDEKLFGDDPLRVLRAAQFAGRFGFNVESKTAEICRSLDLTELPKERIGEEWLKLLMKSGQPSIGLEAMLKLGVLEKLHPELKALVGIHQNPEYHPEGDVWTHTKLVVDAAVQIANENNLNDEEKRLLLLSAICHDLGKPDTTMIQPDGKITSYKHEEIGLPIAEKFLKFLNIHQDVIKKVLLLVDDHMFIHHKESSDSSVRRLARRLYPANIRELAWLATADIRGTTRPGVGKVYTRAEALVVQAELLAVKDSKPKPLIMGRDLLEIGFKPGPIVGETTREIEELQLEGHVTNKEQAIDYARVKLHTIELRGFGLGGLEGRIQRGLDAAGVLAVKETRKTILGNFTK